MIENVRNKIVAGLYAYINKPVIFQPQSTPLPPYPFVAFSITSDYMRTLDDGNVQNVPQLVDLKETLSSNVEITFSFNAYSLNSLEAKNLAKKVHDYFRFVGYQYLADNGIIVVDVGNVQNRDLLEVDQYERREGFDVRVRTLDTIERITPEILDYNIEEVE